jgi:hypothetical protein
LKSKFLPLFFCFCLSLLHSFAQTTVSDFGVFTADEINLKQCEFDKDADAIVLFDKAKAYYNDEHNLMTERRIRLKILKERGIERGNIHIRYYSGDNFEAVSHIEAVIANYDAQSNETRNTLERKSIYNKKLNKYYSEITFALPNVKVGSIIEYKYESQMEHYGGLREWIFQSELPVKLSSYHLTIIPNAQFNYTVYKSPELHISVQRESTTGSVLFEMGNIPGLREEAYMGAARDYLQRVNFQFSGYSRVEGGSYGFTTSSTTEYTTTWKKLATELMDNQDFGSQITKTLAGADLILAGLASQASDFNKMKSIHDYVKSNFSWNHVYTKYADEGVKNAWEKKAGSAAEINFILINLLKSAGLTAQPLLVSERDYGKIDTTYPYVSQFDEVVAYVTVDGKHYILDGTDKETPSFIIPYDLLNTIGFVVDKKNPAFVKIADDEKKDFNMVNVIGEINNDGSMNVEASVNTYDYGKIKRKNKFLNDRKKYEREFLEPYTPTIADTFNVSNLESDSLPLLHNIKLPNYTLAKTGDYLLLNYNLFTGLSKNPFITEQRFSDINFGCRYGWTFSGTFSLPDKLTPETLPKSVKLVVPDKSMAIIRQVEQADNTIKIGIRVEFYKTEYKAEDYPQVQGFYKQMLELLNEPIVLKAKS